MAEVVSKKKKLPKGRHVSQIKRERQSVKRHARNIALKSNLKTQIKKVKDAVASKDKGLADTLLREASRIIQKTASMGVLHARNASRKISRLATMVSQISK